MNFEEVLRMTIALFGQCHVIGNETEAFAAGMKNLKNMANTLKRAREEQEEKRDDEHHDEQE